MYHSCLVASGNVDQKGRSQGVHKEAGDVLSRQIFHLKMYEGGVVLPGIYTRYEHT